MAGLSAAAKEQLARSRLASQKKAQTALMFQRAVLKSEAAHHQQARSRSFCLPGGAPARSL